MRIEAVIFDMDGLMLDTEKLYYQASMEVIAQMGFEPDSEMVIGVMGTPTPTWSGVAKARYGETFDLESFIRRCGAAMERLYQEVGYQVKPGLFELLDYLKKEKIPRAVATSTATDKATVCLRESKIIDYMDQRVFGDMVAHGKPAPDIFLEAARRLGVPPERCLGLEDSHNGIRACRAAGVYTVMVPDMMPATPEILSLTDGCLPTLADVIPLLEKLNKE